MPKFKSKPKFIEARKFEWGLEDGVRRYNEFIPKNGDKYPEQYRSKLFPGYHSTYDDLLADRGFERNQWQPYVITIQGQQAMVSEGDWIITEPDGKHHYPCAPDVFAENYEEVSE